MNVTTNKIIFLPIYLVMIISIYLYKWFVSPFLVHTCRFYPTCSTYAIMSLKEFGVFKGSLLAFKRLIKCSPWSKGGFDPIPQNIKGDSKWII